MGEYKKLNEIATIINGYAFKSSKYITNGYRVIRITNVQKGFLCDDDPKYYAQENSLSKHELFEKDILISLTGNVGRVGFVEKDILPAYLNQRVGCIRINSETILPRYLFHFLNNDLFEQMCIKEAKGIAQLNLSTEWLKNVRVRVPSLEDQQRIVNILDKAEEIRTKKKLANEKLDEFIKSTFIDMFGDTINNPLQWDIKYFKEFISFITSGSRGWAKYYSNSGELFIRIGNVKNAILSMDDTQFVIAPKNKEAERTKVKENDLLISITADLGRTAVVDKKIANAGAYINQHLCLVRLNKLNPIYAAHYIQHEYCKRQIKCLDQVGVKSGLNFDAIRNLKIINPPIELQNQFAQIVQKVEAQKEKNQKVIEQMNNLFNSLMQQAFNSSL